MSDCLPSHIHLIEQFKRPTEIQQFDVPPVAWLYICQLHKQAELLLDDLCTAWAEHGRDAIARMLNQRPGDFVKVVASLVPRELLVGEASPLASLSDDELETLIGSVRALQAKSEEKARSQPAKPH